MSLTAREENLLAALAFKVRVLSLDQVHATWWGNSQRETARRRLAELVTAGHLNRLTVNARPLLGLTAPVAAWEPGRPVPDAREVARVLQGRWTHPPQPTSVYIASQRFARRVGGYGGKLKHRFQVTHDLHVSAVYLRLRSDAPELAEAWVGEEGYAADRRGQKLPDAMLLDANRRPHLAIEFGGGYDTDRVRAFHDDCAQRELAYELW